MPSETMLRTLSNSEVQTVATTITTDSVIKNEGCLHWKINSL